jgi:hypothetical protein
MINLILSLILALTITNDGCLVMMEWDEFIASKHTYIYRGYDLLAILDPGETSYWYFEPHYGIADYTVRQCISGTWYHETERLTMGRLTWQPPSQQVLGYYLYVTGNNYQKVFDIPPCSQIHISALGLPQGGYAMSLTAYNAAGESPPAGPVLIYWFRKVLP